MVEVLQISCKLDEVNSPNPSNPTLLSGDKINVSDAPPTPAAIKYGELKLMRPDVGVDITIDPKLALIDVPLGLENAGVVKSSTITQRIELVKLVNVAALVFTAL